MHDSSRSRPMAGLLLAAAVAVLTLTAAVPVSAFTDEPTQTTATDGDGPEGVGIEEGGDEEEEGAGTDSELGIVPAATIPPAADEDDEQPWTQRFLAPAVLILGVLGLVGSIAYYGMRVKGRYRVVD